MRHYVCRKEKKEKDKGENMERKELTVKEVLDFLNATGLNARQKKSAAKYVAQFNGYESARTNEGTEWEGASVIIITLTDDYTDNINLVWDTEDREWYIFGNSIKPAFHTPSDVIKSSNRYKARRFEDKLVKKSNGQYMNRAISKYNLSKYNELRVEARRLEDLARELRNKAYEYYSRSNNW